MLIFFIGFAFFEFGALCGFFAAALMQAARDGDERAGRSRAENIQYRGVHHEADRPDDSECWTDSTSAVSVKITGRLIQRQAERPYAPAAESRRFQC